MRFSRGQLTSAITDGAPFRAVSYGGYALPLTETTLLGATHDRLENNQNPFEIRREDDVKNIEQYEKHIGGVAKPSGYPSRASIRVTSHDTLPVIGQTETGDFVLTGLGSRDPLPIEKAVWEIFSAKRLFT